LGYYTKYTLIVAPEFYEKVKFDPDLNKVIQFAYSGGEAERNGTWYDHESDMKAISLRYPEIIFQLNGVGEEHLDIWRKYFKGGKVQFATVQITYEDFNEESLE